MDDTTQVPETLTDTDLEQIAAGKSLVRTVVDRSTLRAVERQTVKGAGIGR